ncbi:MAG TPA: glycoside hydrolase family 2 TIM barrel-domain containing protein [Bacteriovoracaceae bacterium]|nr:glycoside hydrolase family 2 TIM barrel-domain containing protein [Bacteriovoracaceae bacterium]
MVEAILDENGANHPRKIFRRDLWKSLNGEWDFILDNNQRCNIPSDVKQWTQKITVPFAPETKASGIGDTGFHHRCWYQRTFNWNKSGKRMMIHFGAVDYQAKVWINNLFAGSHEGGHTPFSFDITNLMNDDGEQIVTVCADDDPHDLTKPRGKQDWQKEPHSIWYPRTTGIWQTVWVEEVPQTYISKLRSTPLLERWEIGCEAFIEGPCPKGLELRIKLTKDNQVLANDRYEVIHNEVHRRIALSDPGIDDFRNELLWSPEKPTLINLELELWLGNKLIDKVHSYTALRSVSYNRDLFLLNGRPYYMRLVLDQGYWPDTFMTPPDAEAIQKDISLIKSAGFNGVRKHQKVEDPDFLYWADVMGLLVWGEMPSAYRFTYESVERITKEWMEVMNRDMNHPCIVVWVPFNESWGVPDLAEKIPHQSCVQALYHLTKTLDPTRPCIGNDGWESVATDILGIHDYDDQPERMLKKYTAQGNVDVAAILDKYRPGGRVITVEGYAHKGQPVMLTEFGGIAFVEPSESIQHTWGYSAASSSQEFRRRYEDLMNAIHRIELFTGFCYTQFTDTFQEANGLFKADRTPKFPLGPMCRSTRGVGLGRGELIGVPQPPPVPHDNEHYERVREQMPDSQ